MSLLSRIIPNNKLDNKSLILLFTSLSYMESAGLTHHDAVDILIKNPDHKINRDSLQVMKDGFEEGLILSQVLRDHEDIFGVGWWRQVDAAERTGKVPECLLRIVAQLKNMGNIMSKIRGALIYPIFVVIIALGAGYYLLTHTIPEMGAMMEELGGELPGITVFMIHLCDLLTVWGWLFLIIIIAAIFLISWLLTHPLKMQWHKFITKFFLSGGISINLNFSVVYTLINDMIENGSNIVDALRIAAGSASNIYITSQLMDCADTMDREGLGLAQALQGSKSMPGDDRMMLDVGSRTGREMELLQDMSFRRNAEAIDATNRLLELMSPLIMVFVCIIVGILVVSIYMPMLTMATTLS